MAEVTQAVGLEDALAVAVELGSGCGFAYSSLEAVWFELEMTGGKATPLGKGGPLHLDRIFEAHAFGHAGGVAWERTAPGEGAMRRVDHAAEGSSAEIHETRGLLWGTADEVAERWVSLREDRVSTIWIPLAAFGDGPPPAKGDRVVLVSREAWVIDAHGNTRVSSTQPVGLEVAS